MRLQVLDSMPSFAPARLRGLQSITLLEDCHHPVDEVDPQQYPQLAHDGVDSAVNAMLEAPPASTYFACDTRFTPQDASGPGYHLSALEECEHTEGDTAPELVGVKRLPAPIFPAVYGDSVYPDLSSPSATETSVESEPCAPVFDYQADDDALRPYIQGHQLVLDSATPWRTPHIAICFTPQTWDQHVIPLYNGIPPQDPGHLGVPSSATESSHDICPLNTADGREDVEPVAHEEPGPARVFGHAAFTLWIQKTSVERLIFCSVVTALQRRNFQLVARAASKLAGALYGRYESSNVFSHLERPFVWSDQALPLLDASQHPPGTLILESDHPLTVPHIIITPELKDDPWTAAMNLPTFPQDGRYLMVYYHNMQVWWGPEWLQAQMEAQWQYHLQNTQCLRCALLASDCRCPPLDSVVESNTEDAGYWPVDEDDRAQYATAPTDELSSDDNTPPLTPESYPRPACNVFSVEEDDDELPSIEEWCKSLERSKGQR